MKALPLKLLAGSVLLLTLALPAPAARKSGGFNDRSLDSRDLMQKSHKKTQAEKDARQMDKNLKRSDAQEKREAELLKRFDKNHDGVLDDAEKAAMEAALKKQEEKRDGK